MSKPSGMLSHNSAWAGPSERALLQTARDRFGQRVWLAQRLDRGTSGVMLLTFDPSAVARWTEAVAAGEKRYLAITRGRMRAPAVVDKPLKDDKGVERAARTTITPLAVSEVERVSLVLCALEHGRIHQARRHLNRASHPVVNDSNHGDTRFNRGFREPWRHPRLMLHAWQLRLRHPDTGARLCIEAPPSDDWSDLVRQLFGEIALADNA